MHTLIIIMHSSLSVCVHNYYVCACVCVCVCACVCLSLHVHVHVHMTVCVCVYIYDLIDIYAQTHACKMHAFSSMQQAANCHFYNMWL